MIHRRKAQFFALSFVASLAACSADGDTRGANGSGVVAGTLLFVPADAPLTEVEPNDGVDEPQPIGDLAPGRAITIRGSIGADEGFDGYAFVARERVRVTAEVRFAAAPDRRVDLFAYDPIAMGVVARAENASGLALDVAGPFDLVVRGASGVGDYELVVRALPAIETPSTSGWIGSFVVGDTLRGASGRFEATAAEAAHLRITARGEANRTLRAKQVTRDGEAAIGSATTGSVLEIDVDPLARIAIETEAGGAFDVEVVERSGTPDLRIRADRLLATERERAQIGLATGDALYGRAPTNAKAGEVLVKIVGGADISRALARRGLARIDQIGEDTLQVAADLALVPEGEARARVTVALARSLAWTPRVEYAELNRLRKRFGGTTPYVPNDGFYGLQWHYPLIRLPEAWGEVRTTVTAPGDLVTVAVIDTGRRPHSDLDANTNTAIEYDFITDPAIAADGGGPDANAFDVGDTEGIGPSSYHGTHVAGTIAAVMDNGVQGSSVCGVAAIPVGMPLASRVRVVHLRVLGKGGGTDADIARAVRYAAGLPNPGLPALTGPLDVINMSLGGPGFNQTVQNAVTAARNRGVVVFAAAGNENSSTPSFPAAYADVVSVAAVDQNLAHAPYSNFHATVDLTAPGGDTSVNTNPGTNPGQDDYVDGVLSTLVDQTTGDPLFVFYQGTSMACPHAAGLAALMLIVNPDLEPGEIETKLAETATDLGAPGRDSTFGEGLINALAAVQSAGTGGPATPTLAVNPGVLNFGTDTTELDLVLTNAGFGTVDVITVLDDAAWLTLVNGGPGTGIDVGSVTVLVDRAHPDLAADGTYTATISITSDSGNETIPVTVLVATPVFPDIDLYVVAVDLSVDPPVTVAQTIVNPSLVGFEYVLDELSTNDGQLLPPGEYLIACGSNEGADLLLCGPGDVYCGLYPTLNDPALVVVSGTVTGIDFVVAPVDSGPLFTSFSGYPLLRR